MDKTMLMPLLALMFALAVVGLFVLHNETKKIGYNNGYAACESNELRHMPLTLKP